MAKFSSTTIPFDKLYTHNCGCLCWAFCYMHVSSMCKHMLPTPHFTFPVYHNRDLSHHTKYTRYGNMHMSLSHLKVMSPTDLYCSMSAANGLTSYGACVVDKQRLEFSVLVPHFAPLKCYKMEQ